jgi:hypothetical protein
MLKPGDKSPAGSKATLGNLRAPRLEDNEEGTSEHVGDDSNVKSSYKSSAVNLKKGKILVDLKHSGDYKAFSAADKNLTTKLMTLKESIRKDPLSVFTPELTDGLILAMGDMAFYRPEKPLQALSNNMKEYSVTGFEKSKKTLGELPTSSQKLPSRQATKDSLPARPDSKDSKASARSKDSANSKASKGSKGSKTSKKSKDERAAKKKPTEPIKEAKNEDSENADEEEADEEGGDEEGGKGGSKGDEEGEEEYEEEGEEEEEASKKDDKKKALEEF